MKFSRKINPDSKPSSNYITKTRLREDEINFDKLRFYRLDRVKKELEKNIVLYQLMDQQYFMNILTAKIYLNI